MKLGFFLRLRFGIDVSFYTPSGVWGNNNNNAKLEQLEAFEARIAANEGFIARIDTLEDLRCCKDVKCQNYRGTLAVTKKGHTCQDWDKDNVNKNPNNDPDS